MNTPTLFSETLDPECPALTVINLSAGYAQQPIAIEAVNFAVDHGERVAIIGPNGAGKSTLFKVLVGLVPHTSGEISLHGEDCHTSHTMIGYVPQHEAVDWDFPVNVRDVIMMGRTRNIGWLRWPRRRDRLVVDAVLEQVGLTGFGKRQISQLSGGQRRRVFIARALAQETNVLLLDEPFGGVDAVAEQEIMETLDRLQEMNITVLLATHDLTLASTRADRLLVLKRRVFAYGRPNEVFTPDVLQKVYGKRLGVIQQGTQTFLIADEHHHH
jgi:ABC-type Mn2+/Zn2+ transport system ATPase subunit